MRTFPREVLGNYVHSVSQPTEGFYCLEAASSPPNQELQTFPTATFWVQRRPLAHHRRKGENRCILEYIVHT